MVSVKVLGVHLDAATGSTLVLLGEDVETTRVLPIFVGPAEAQAILIGLQGLELPRPGTHDIVAQLLERLHARITSMVVTELRDNTFYAELGVETADETIQLSIRPSDGIALAVRTGVPIQVRSEVLDDAGVEIVHPQDTPFSDDEVESIVGEFQEFLATAEPQDFAPPDGPDGDEHDDTPDDEAG
ncbi:MAG: bifunctional nuclease family protein [Acidimicrobiia bacterium]|nr:bifunctional nuclease family protein [Acidimicrobiia bacterium]